MKDVTQIIKEYETGMSLSELAKKYGTYPTSIKRLLEKNHISLRHDTASKGCIYVKDGEKLIEWAKAQGRQVTKAELAKVLGKTRLSHSYFIKYPELGQYVRMCEPYELTSYTNQLNEWLRNNHISFKPNDKKTLGVTVSALLLGEYRNIALQIAVKPKCVSRQRHTDAMHEKLKRANEKGMIIFFVEEAHFKDLDCLKGLLNSLAYSKE